MPNRYVRTKRAQIGPVRKVLPNGTIRLAKSRPRRNYLPTEEMAWAIIKHTRIRDRKQQRRIYQLIDEDLSRFMRTLKILGTSNLKGIKPKTIFDAWDKASTYRK